MRVLYDIYLIIYVYIYVYTITNIRTTIKFIEMLYYRLYLLNMYVGDSNLIQTL